MKKLEIRLWVMLLVGVSICLIFVTHSVVEDVHNRNTAQTIAKKIFSDAKPGDLILFENGRVPVLYITQVAPGVRYCRKIGQADGFVEDPLMFDRNSPKLIQRDGGGDAYQRALLLFAKQ
jgi:hypothetical protein